ncbi:MAG: DUF4173 domain-containing protein [Ruminococcaceae bacterium]|nr:DUF4173 domain-containing protein [Oscillospiraceae bacterium]
MNEPIHETIQNPTKEPTTSPIPAPRTYAAAESVFAWVCLLVGYLLCRTVPVALSPLGGCLCLLVLYVATLTVLRVRGFAFSVSVWCAAGSGLLTAAAMLISADAFLRQLCFWYALAAYAYTVHAMTGNTLRHGLSDLVLVDAFKAAVIQPFCAHGGLFAAMFAGKAKGSGKAIGKVLVGLLLALIPTAAVLSLLSYDSGFSSLLSTLFDVNAPDVFSHLVSIAFGIPIGMYLFGMLISNIDHEAGSILTEEDCTKTATACRVIAPLTVAAATVPMLFVYAIFFVSQWQYYVAGFTGVLPEGFQYASFAREGFFQLCTVAVINLAMILGALWLTKRADDKPGWLLRILTALYSVFTLVLIATAMAKMLLYIDAYGLTQKRVYATWFMVVLAVVFVIIAVGVFVPKMKTVLVCTAVCVVMFAGLALSNVNGVIADYNVAQYLNGELKTVDVGALEQLDEAATPALCRLYESYVDSGKTTGTTYFRVKNVLRAQATELAERGLWSFSIPQMRAVSALKAAGIEG